MGRQLNQISCLSCASLRRKYDKLSVIYSRSKESNHSDGAGRSEGRLLGPASSHSSSSSVEENEVSQRHNQEPARAARPAPTPPAAGAPRPAYQSSEVHSLPRQAPSPHVPLYRGPSSVPQSPMSMQAQPNGSYAGGAGRYYPPTATAYRQPSAPVAAAYKQPLQQTRSAQQFTSQVRPQPVASSYNAAYGGAPTASLQGNRRAQPQASQARPSAYPGTAVHPGYAQHRPVTVSRERSPASATRRTGAAAVVPPTARQQAPVFGQDRGFMSNGKPPVRRQVDTMM
jgi:hypothetical protein